MVFTTSASLSSKNSSPGASALGDSPSSTGSGRLWLKIENVVA